MNLDRHDWLSRRVEDAIDPDRVIVDPHHHLWDRGGSTYLAAELAADTSRSHRVVQTVFVECLAGYREDGPEALRPVGETEFVAGEADTLDHAGGPTIAGIVGFADLRLGAAVDEVLAAHEAASGGRFRGVRHATAWVDHREIRSAHTRPTPGLMLDPGFQAGVRVLAARRHTYDAWLYHPQLPELVQLARTIPETTIVLNHLGAPLAIGPYRDVADDVDAVWKAGMTLAASCPNVYLKIGGIGMDNYFVTGWSELPEPPGSEEVAAFWSDRVRWCIDTFGPERAMFESNFPVDRQALTYAVLWNSFQRMASGYDQREQDALFSGTARAVYRLAG